MTSKKTERVVVAAAAILAGSATGLIGPAIGAIATDYAIEKLKRKSKDKPLR